MATGPQWRRMVILTEGKTGRYTSKAAAGIIRYRREDVVAIIDSVNAGKDIEPVLGVGRGLPVVSDVATAMKYKPETLVIGIAPIGGGLPPEWRKHVLDGMKAGLDVVSGLHVFLNDDAEFASAAKKYGRTIYDVRKPKDDLPVGGNRAVATRAKRVLTVGSDGNIGKMHTSLELTAELKKRGRDAEFVATGQIGIMISGRGVPLDHVISDFTAGAIEQELLERGDHEILSVEGQGAVIHPGFSAVTLGLIHGTAPDAMIFCHNPAREKQNWGVKIPPLKEHIQLHEDLCKYTHPTKVVALSLNCAELDEAASRDAVKRLEDQVGLPASDPIKFGCAPIADAVEKFCLKK